ncbi:MAG: pyridoxal-phosphate dependent enzyme [Alphaproteobacteria bacterium]|nr:pyridoxal-phosphate dependent enzyme [Alphaproteobacteria bacterium]
MITDPLRDLPTFSDIESAARRLEGVAFHTPLLRNEALDTAIGAPVWIKPETLQRTGSFKMRGAWNRISRIPEADQAKGVVAFSSGNHAQGVAESARILGLKATIVMPSDAPQSKIASARARGAEVRLYNRNGESREAIAAEIAERTGATTIKPFDDAWIMAGQGTAGYEAGADAKAMGVHFGSVICNASGGGLLAGVALAFEEIWPYAEVYAAEPEGHDDLIRSLAAGRIVSNAPGSRSIADALMAPEPGVLPFQIHQRRVAGGFAATNDQLLDAMSFAFHHLNLVVEPGGAAALAVLLANREYFAARAPVLLVLTGANVDPEIFAQAISRPPLA